MPILTENEGGEVPEVILKGEVFHTTRTVAIDASGACSVYQLWKELHDKHEHGSEDDPHMNYSNYTCHRALLAFDGVEFQAEN